jgi:hypothetical protein
LKIALILIFALMNLITINSRVMWFEYSYDGYIAQTGYGTVLDISLDPSIVILCDDGSIKNFDKEMLQYFEDWEE